MEGVRILRSVRLLGEDRRHGDVLTSEQFAQIPDAPRDALLSTGYAEVVLSEAEQEQASAQHLSARLDACVERIGALEVRLAGLEAKPRRGRPKKEG
ncbi:MAG: hypothetical protein ACYSWU_24700 [Planctomycetota bacterium]|jgi:hypothetical protein